MKLHKSCVPFVTGILLAAGPSRRMGRSKQLLTFRGESLLRRAAREAAASGLGEVIVVLGHEADRLEGELTGLPVRVVRNPRYLEGMSTSLRAGLKAASSRAKAALFLLADQPRVDAALIDHVLAAYARQRPQAVVPVAGERPGNPVLVDRRHFPALLRLQGDVGGRPVVRALGEGVLRLPVEEELLEDVDRPEDYQALGGEEGAPTP